MYADVVYRIAGLLATVGVCSNAMMDQFWEMYEAYKTKKPWQTMKDTDWGKSTELTLSLTQTNGQYWLQKGKGKQWLEGCTQVDIEVVGKYVLPCAGPWLIHVQ